jgi:hypothetical protein
MMNCPRGEKNICCSQLFSTATMTRPDSSRGVVQLDGHAYVMGKCALPLALRPLPSMGTQKVTRLELGVSIEFASHTATLEICNIPHGSE